METKPYRIKHRPTGLYFQPSHDGTNLSTKGKVYLTKTSPLSMNGSDGGIWIGVREGSNVFKKFHNTLGLEEKGWRHQHTKLIPKSEFEQEFL